MRTPGDRRTDRRWSGDVVTAISRLTPSSFSVAAAATSSTNERRADFCVRLIQRGQRRKAACLSSVIFNSGPVFISFPLPPAPTSEPSNPPTRQLPSASLDYGCCGFDFANYVPHCKVASCCKVCRWHDAPTPPVYPRRQLERAAFEP